MALDVLALRLGKKYTEETADEFGAVKGAPCTIKSKTAIEGGTRLVLGWENNSGEEQETTVDLMNGAKGDEGLGIKSSVINASNHLILTYDDDTTEDAGEIKNINTDFAHISDINLDNVEDGQILKYNGTSGKWENDSASSVDTNLVDLRDVDITSATDGQVLTWDATNSKWVNGDGVAVSVSDLEDVDLTSLADGDILVYDATGQKWVRSNALSNKVDKETGKSLIDLTTVVDGASYDSTNHLILFKHQSTTLFSLDAAAFVKDGMVDTVTITGGNLVITFNTDAGKQAISIPLTDIFDPANYYDKTATDNLLADKADVSDLADYQTKNLTSTIEGGTTVEGALGALSTNKQPKTLDTPITIGGTSQTTVEGALGGLNSSLVKCSRQLTSMGDNGGSVSYHKISVVCGSRPINNTFFLSSRNGEFWVLGSTFVSASSKSVRARRVQTGASKITEIKTVFSNDGKTLDIYLKMAAYCTLLKVVAVDDATAELSATIVTITSSDYDAVTSDGSFDYALSTSDTTSNVTSGSTAPITSGGVYTALQNKADKVTSATNGNFAGLDASGNLVDSGKKASDFVSAANLDALNQIAAGVYEGTDLTVKFADEIADYSDEWAWVQARLDAHDLSGMLPGDYIPIVVGTETHQAQIAGINTYYDTCDSGYEVKYHIDWITRDCYGGATVKWNTTDNNNGSSAEASPFLASNLNSWLNSTLYGLLEAKLKAVIKEKRILAPTRYQNGSSLTDDNSWAWKTTGKLWVPYETEIFDNVQWSTKGFGESQNVQYEIFRNSYRARRKKQGPTGARAHWWTASAGSGSATDAVRVGGGGYSHIYSASGSFYAPVCFRTMATT